jgi:hypothetical protein
VYEVLDQAYNRFVETWRFEPGQRVVCEWMDGSDGPMLAAVRLAQHDPGRPIPAPRFARIRYEFWTVRGVHLAFILGGAVLGVVAVGQAVVEIGRGEWSLPLTVVLFAVGAAVVGLNVIFPTTRSGPAAQSVGVGAYSALLTLLHWTGVDVDSVMTARRGTRLRLGRSARSRAGEREPSVAARWRRRSGMSGTSIDCPLMPSTHPLSACLPPGTRGRAVATSQSISFL